MPDHPKNILFYFAWQLNPVHFGVVIEQLERVIAQNKGEGKIYFLSCDGVLKPCHTNREGDPAKCTLCQFNNDTALSKYKGQVEVLKISDYNRQYSVPTFEYNSVPDIKKLRYKDVQIGYGAFSTYISATRNLEPIMDSEFREYFDKMLASQVMLTDVVLDIIEQKEIGSAYFFNGRTADTRPLYDICKTREIPFVSLEFAKKNDQEFFINEFFNCLPHDIDFNHQRVLSVWENAPESVEERIRFGSDFYEKRKNGIADSEKRNYVAGQDKELLPENWDASKKNIGIFISSEDEFAAIGDIFDKLAVFRTQEEGIHAILQQMGNREGYHFYIRVHPNLKAVKYSYVTRLQDFQGMYDNVTVIDPKSRISTYALIDYSDVTLAFGSTVGAEAAYWRKPSIILAACWYYHLDIGYKPKNVDEVVALLEQDLSPGSKLDAIKYGYYLSGAEKFMRPNAFNPFPISFMGKSTGLGHKHLTVLGSPLLYKLKLAAYKSILGLRKNKKLTIPRKGM
ncbi:hypothetical protein [Flavobacterium pallidum]|uniref:Capsule biosynthesis protein n=1 Tax=Flavobacterium pallidum TaxID=2172098 RepID=A0A2S1SDI5_9FLAO|nr:hypothetical protein [Flavobacterium pallidum]AWI24455.1 hypothetical protein HYN49_00305 [Flavobacterium pallidum]